MAIHMKYSCKFQIKRIIQKKKVFLLFNALLGGVTKLEAFQWVKVTKLNPSKSSPLYCQVRIRNDVKCRLYPVGL
jgi:hypothetical protein